MRDDRRRSKGFTETVHLDGSLAPVRSRARPTAVLDPGSRVDGRYEVVRVLGSGGFAVVYLAVDLLSEDGQERRVALKVLRPDRVDEASLTRFRREARIANATHSRHLVRILDLGHADVGAGTPEGSPYLVLEHVDGESLAHRLDRGLLPTAEAVELARQVLEGLAALHRHGVLHRDVKPQNILLDGDGDARLADFGLARSWGNPDETRATRADSVVGTVEYLAPEQALGEEVDARSDLYSLGVVLFEMLTGRLPHQARSSLGTLLAHIQQPTPDVRRLRPDVPGWLASLVARLLEKRPEDRYPDAETVLRQLDRHRAGRTRTAALRHALAHPAEALRSVAALRRQGSSRRRSSAVRRHGPGWAARLFPGLAVLGLVVVASFVVASFALDRTPLLPAAPGESLRSARPLPGVPFSHVSQGPDGLRGIAADGTILWSRPGDRGTLLPARLKPGEPPRLVGFLSRAPDSRPAAEHRLAVLDAATGRRLRRVALPVAPDFFPTLSDTYGLPRPFVADLDGDGLDEVLATWSHSPYWPSFTSLYEPRVERTRLVLVASGHHRPVAAEDLDGDGSRELVFLGTGNRIGWYTTAAAVRLVPTVNATGREPGDAGSRGPPGVATTPDHALGPHDDRLLLWYALMPRRVATGQREVRVDREGRRLTFEALVGEPWVLGFDGFPPDPGRGPEANAHRTAVYRHLREARRRTALGGLEPALEEIAEAAGRSRAAGDAVLSEWVRRTEALVRASAGDADGAEALYEALFTTSALPSDVGYDAGRAFFLAAHPERAARWFRRGLSVASDESLGRNKNELLDGLVFSLLELGRPEEALAEIQRTFPEFGPDLRGLSQGDLLRDFVGWSRGGLAAAEDADAALQIARGLEDCGAPVREKADLWAFLGCERAYAAGASAETLLPRVDRELARSSEWVPALMSLRAELLHRLGRTGEARETLRAAHSRLQREAGEEIYARASSARVLERYRRLGDAPAPASPEPEA